MEGRRHSVDVPISKTLVALRRVRSLRDPSTHSMSKFSSIVDSLHWDTNSCNGISLRFGNGCQEGNLSNNWDLSKILGTCGEEEDENVMDFESKEYTPKSISKSNVSKSVGKSGTKGKHEGDDKSPSLKYGSEYRDNGLELACVSPSNDPFKGVDSNHGSTRSTPIRNQSYGGCKGSIGSLGDFVSRGGSPSLCASDTLLDGSTRSASLFANEEIDALDEEYRGCGITCCWSKTPRYRDPSLASDGEEYPLISGETGDTDIMSGTRSWKHINNEVVPYSESPRSLSQKFRPKSFDELIGQGVATRSLLGAILKGRITTFYLFHGPRGAGKTSASRIFAAALNCLSLDEQRPCRSCQECMLYFAGRSRDVKEVDPVRINRAGRMRSFIKSASLPPISSKFKVIILDECHLIRSDTWATLLSNMESFSQHAVFVMVTPDLDKLPRNVVARSHRYHFPKLKDVDVTFRLGNICVEEGIEFDQAALEFIASKSNGSMRDGEMMLDQLSMLGSKITKTLAYELVGTVSDDELLDLLDLSLSADTSNTVKRARELMRSRIDPMQLISQLANIIMDILAGKFQDEDSEIRRNFMRRHASETDMQKIRNALKILSESEKQLRVSKNQTTWLTVALLQLNSTDPSFSDPNESRLSVRTSNSEAADGDCSSTASLGERSKHLVSYDCADEELRKMVAQGECEGALESIWIRATEICHSHSLRSFLRRRGRLSSVRVKKDLAVAELEFDHPNYASKAENSWKLIASSLQSVLKCNVELRINLSHSYAKSKRPSFSLFSCSRRIHKSNTTENGSDRLSDASNFTSDKAMIGDNKHVETCSSCGSQVSHICSHRMVTIIRNSDGNALSTAKSGASTPHRVSQDSMSSEHEKVCKILTVEEQEVQPNCFPKNMRLSKKMTSSESSELLCLKVQPKASSREASFDAYICTDYPYVLRNGSNKSDISQHEDGKMEDSKSHCWKTPPFSMKKGWQMKHQRQRSHLVEWVLPCTTAK
ncbi:protein STICHEL-like 2 [Spinacia oleracea]|uniref:Protein STICHEL-like 2 n=1 Tax=Spinacia oleracea TaxID=3562 RepID=A0A9R0ITU3_SPIOL|nr:protein STICHEL-like 2 [Spinacia oleracea]XP_021855227.2 protein STICHEL-like 2 [Spinacia oleracea]